MVSRLYVIRYSGVLIYDLNLGEESLQGENREFLISGVLSAVSSLAREIFGERIEMILLQNQRIFLRFYDDFFIALIASINSNQKEMENIMERIAELIEITLSNSEYNGNLNIFYELTPRIKKIIEECQTKHVKLREKYHVSLRRDLENLPFFNNDLTLYLFKQIKN
ncbi:MAG: hypothetical protein ACXQS8_02475 [Candidatus Helarchaeales archaeon]